MVFPDFTIRLPGPPGRVVAVPESLQESLSRPGDIRLFLRCATHAQQFPSVMGIQNLPFGTPHGYRKHSAKISRAETSPSNTPVRSLQDARSGRTPARTVAMPLVPRAPWPSGIPGPSGRKRRSALVSTSEKAISTPPTTKEAGVQARPGSQILRCPSSCLIQTLSGSPHDTKGTNLPLISFPIHIHMIRHLAKEYDLGSLLGLMDGGSYERPSCQPRSIQSRFVCSAEIRHLRGAVTCQGLHSQIPRYTAFVSVKLRLLGEIIHPRRFGHIGFDTHACLVSVYPYCNSLVSVLIVSLYQSPSLFSVCPMVCPTCI
ncbi:hypothetical protein H4582DRAFT_991078 [Lactarius indigo]|nr:hypothetical protein H4582DRAFT_991078 [Lactarius indigo]